jgi:hypothetical protein
MSGHVPEPASQASLLELLQADLDRAASLLAKTGISNPVDRLSIVQEATNLLKRIRQMEGRIQDPKVWQAIHTRANEIDRALENFPN